MGIKCGAKFLGDRAIKVKDPVLWQCMRGNEGSVYFVSKTCERHGLIAYSNNDGRPIEIKFDKDISTADQEKLFQLEPTDESLRVEVIPGLLPDCVRTKRNQDDDNDASYNYSWESTLDMTG